MKKILFGTLCVVLIYILIYFNSLPKRVLIEYKQDKEVRSWNDIFKSKTKLSSFKALNTGSVLVPLHGVLNESKLPLNYNLDKTLWVDVFAFLFHHQDRGWILIDTGLDSTFQTTGNLSGLMVKSSILNFKQTKEQNIGRQLEKLDVIPDEIYFTHLHADHTSGLPELMKTIPLYVGKGETIINFPLFFSHEHFKNIESINEINWEKGNSIYPFNSAINLFGDDSFWAISTPGHSASHLSYILKTKDEIILLTGDASHTRYGFMNLIEPGWHDNSDQALQSLTSLKKFTELGFRVKVIYGHER